MPVFGPIWNSVWGPVFNNLWDGPFVPSIWTLNLLEINSLPSYVTFSRASSATYYNSSGVLTSASNNTPRFDYNPATLRTNLQTYSQDLGPWSPNSSPGRVLNNEIAPDGSMTADTITFTGASSFSGYFRSYSIATSGSYTLSMYVKPTGANSTVSLGGNGNNTARTTYNFNTNTFGTTGALITATNATPADNGYTRISITWNATAGLGSFEIYCGVPVAGSLAVWGMQTEVGSVATSYIPTTNTVVSVSNPRGLLLEPQRTNIVSNNTMIGAVAGTPGTLPTGWSQTSPTTLGFTRTIIGTGVENGISYIDAQYAGTTTGLGGTPFITLDSVATTPGTVWSGMFGIRLIAGTANNNLRFNVQMRWTGGTPTTVTSSNTTPDSTLQWLKFENQAAPTGTTAMVAVMNHGVSASGVAMDFTVRIYMPQWEVGAFNTSIIPTSGSAATRSADSFIISNLSNINYNTTEGTASIDFESYSTIPNNSFESYLSINTSNASYMELNKRNFQSNGRFQTASAVSTEMLMVNSVGSVTKQAFTYKATGYTAVSNGGTVVTHAANPVPTVNKLQAGSGVVYNPAAIWLRRLYYNPVQVSNSELQALTV